MRVLELVVRGVNGVEVGEQEGQGGRVKGGSGIRSFSEGYLAISERLRESWVQISGGGYRIPAVAPARLHAQFPEHVASTCSELSIFQYLGVRLAFSIHASAKCIIAICIIWQECLRKK